MFYWRFIKDFYKVVVPLCRLLEKKSVFEFDVNGMKAFVRLKDKGNLCILL